MKTRLQFILVALLLVTLACNFGAKSTQSVSEATAVEAATPTPVPEKPREQPTSAPTDAATLAPTPLAPTAAPEKPVAALPPAVEGPEMLDLTSPALFQHPLSEYSEHHSMVISGVDQGEQPLDLTDERTVRFQSSPSAAWYKTSQSVFDDAPLESAMVDGQQYTVSSDGQCAQTTAGDPPVRVFSLLGAAFTGQAQRVEAGVTVNGLIADRYEITEANLVPDAQIELTETDPSGATSTTTIKIIGTGSLYLARQGSFVIKIELTASKTAEEADFFFKVGSEMTNTTLFEMMPTAAGETPVAPPAACQGAADAGDDPGVAQGDWPRMDDAALLVEDSSTLVYQTYYTIDEVSQFYKTEMANLGWTLTDETNLGSIISLTFTKDGEEVSIDLLQTGDTVTVTISQ